MRVTGGQKMSFLSTLRVEKLSIHKNKNSKTLSRMSLRQLRGQNFAIFWPLPPAWTVFVPWEWTKTNIFRPPPPSSCPRSYWMAPYRRLLTRDKIHMSCHCVCGIVWVRALYLFRNSPRRNAGPAEPWGPFLPPIYFCRSVKFTKTVQERGGKSCQNSVGVARY